MSVGIHLYYRSFYYLPLRTRLQNPLSIWACSGVPISRHFKKRQLRPAHVRKESGYTILIRLLSIPPSTRSRPRSPFDFDPSRLQLLWEYRWVGFESDRLSFGAGAGRHFAWGNHWQGKKGGEDGACHLPQKAGVNATIWLALRYVRAKIHKSLWGWWVERTGSKAETITICLSADPL